MLDDYRYIFIVTYARSGSTLLQSLLNSADGVQIRGENGNFAHHLFRASEALKETGRHGRSPDTAAPDHPWYGAGAIRPWRLRRKMLNAFVADVLAPDADVKVTGFKEIRHNPFFMTAGQFQDYMDFLLDGFPQARVICNSRNAEDVSRSGFLRDRDPQVVMRDVRAADDWFRRLCDRRPENCLHLQYETYTADPASLAAMYDFAGLPHDADAVRAVLGKRLDHARGKPL